MSQGRAPQGGGCITPEGTKERRQGSRPLLPSDVSGTESPFPSGSVHTATPVLSGDAGIHDTSILRKQFGPSFVATAHQPRTLAARGVSLSAPRCQSVRSRPSKAPWSTPRFSTYGRVMGLRGAARRPDSPRRQVTPWERTLNETHCQARGVVPVTAVISRIRSWSPPSRPPEHGREL